MILSTLILILIIAAVELWRLYLVLRKWRSFKDYPPGVLQPFIKDEDYKRLYVKNFMQCASMATEICLSLTIKVLKLSLIEYHEYVWDMTKKYAATDVSRSVWFIALDVLITLCVEKPFQLIGLVIINPEANHHIMDHLRSLAVEVVTTSVLAGLFAQSAMFILERFGAINLLLPVLIFEFIGFLTVVFVGTIVVPMICRPLSTLVEAEKMVRELAKAQKFPEKKILVDVTKERHPYAYYLGTLGRNILVINQELIETVTPKQTVALVAHEMGHWRYGHNSIKLVFVLGEMMMFSILSIVVYGKPSVDNMFGFPSGKAPHPILRSYLAKDFIWPCLIEVYKGSTNVISAQFEYRADKWACSKGYGEHLKSALPVVEGHSASPEFDNFFSVWFYGKPTVVERMKRIERYPSSGMGGDTQNRITNLLELD